jgi:hypothetical protein
MPGALKSLEPFLVAAPWHRGLLHHAPLGVTIPPENVIDPTRLEAATFLRRLSVLDRLTFGPEGMPMPAWIFYHAAEVPGAIMGFAHRIETLAEPIARRLELGRDDRGLVPLSMYIAIPTRAPGAWIGHNLASLNRLLPELNLRGLASITKAVALKAFRCRVQVGAVQWDSPALHVHTRFGALELLSAWTPAHSEPATLSYRWTVTEEALRSGMGDPGVALPRPPADFEIAVGDADGARALQARIESGERFVIPGPPRRAADGTVNVPVARCRPAT